jgi:methyltransferase (TIGR00027 family)
MRTGRASNTAMMVAVWRALGDRGLTTVPGFSDPAAAMLLRGSVWGLLLDRIERSARKSASHPSGGFVPWIDSLVLRVAFIDAVLAETRAPQVVILGAGLDTRAWRLAALKGVRVFEVDHPATQSFKRARAGKLGTPLAELTYVPIDFTRDDLAITLRAAGFDPSVPTAWVWEGVTMYLGDQALRGTLAAIRGLSAPGSRLVAHYHEPEAHRPRGSVVRKLLFSLLGEPQIGLRTAATMTRELELKGFRILEDAGLEEQAARVGTQASAHARLRVSRIAVATVQA